MPSILITGANRGIGLEFVRQYLREGWDVHACCRKPESFEQKLVANKNNQDKLSVHQVDVGNIKEITSVSSALSKIPIDIIINNAGIADGYGSGIYELKEDPDIRNYDFEFWGEMMNINTIAPARIAAAFLDNLLIGKEKIIVNLSSGLASIGNLSWTGKYGYCASKAGLNMLSRGLANWLKPKEIIVISLSPGWTKTDMGGAKASNTVENSVSGMRKVIANLNIEKSGRFWNFDGDEIPW